MSSFPRVVPTLNEPSISENRDGHASADAKPLRVSVNFSNGTRVLIPVKQDFTVSDLVTEAVRRAKALNLPCATDDVNLYSADGDILFGEDGLRDILFLEETPNLFLASQSPHFPVSPLVGRHGHQSMARANFGLYRLVHRMVLRPLRSRMTKN